MKGKLYKLVALCLVSAMLLSFIAACTSSTDKPAPSAGNLAFPMEVIDQTGRTVIIEKIPDKIISLAPSNTEILYSLGLSEKLVAVTDFCDYPPEAKEKPSIGGFSTPNMEEVVAHSPDLILATSIHEITIIPQLEQKGFTVLALSPQTIDEVFQAITLVGKITGKEEEASKMVTEMQNRTKVVTDKVAGLPEGQRPRIFYITWHDPLMAPGSGTLQDDLIRKVGGTNITHNLTDYANVSLEVIIDANPEAMIAGVGHGIEKDLNFQFIETESRLRDTNARRNNRIYAVDGNLVSRPGPRIVDGLEELARLIHPEIFSSS